VFDWMDPEFPDALGRFPGSAGSAVIHVEH
jgi:hypothetical protein